MSRVERSLAFHSAPTPTSPQLLPLVTPKLAPKSYSEQSWTELGLLRMSEFDLKYQLKIICAWPDVYKSDMKLQNQYTTAYIGHTKDIGT